MSLLAAKWLAVIGLSLAAVSYCGTKLYPKWGRAFEWAASVNVFAVNAALIWLCIKGMEGLVPSLEVMFRNGRVFAQDAAQKLADLIQD